MKTATTPPSRTRLRFDDGWRFTFGHATDPKLDFNFGIDHGIFSKTGTSTGVRSADFDDSGWRLVDLPHDWAVELPFDDMAVFHHGYKPVGRGSPSTTIGWYRKNIEVPESERGRRITIEFDGVFRDSMMWLNGHLLGRHESGYCSFQYDLTDYVLYGQKNVLTVRVDASHSEGWFYEGAGIYRHVWLVKTAPAHVAHWGVFVKATPKAGRGVIATDVTLVNESDQATIVALDGAVLDAKGKSVAKCGQDGIALKPWEERLVTLKAEVKAPKLWSLEEPNLYTWRTTVRQERRAVDCVDTTFGIRSIRFDPDKGFFLNDQPVKIRGVCNHQDHAGVGSALPDRLQAFRIERLKEMGCNAIRTSHNPPTPELLDACDRMGMLVMDEHRMAGVSREILSQLERLVRRDRNHPSVIIWSILNEELIQWNELGNRIAAPMARLVKRLDPTRPVTAAAWGGKGYFGVVDVLGVNYIHLGDMDKLHAEHPKEPICGTEEGSVLSTRGVYFKDDAKGYAEAYDKVFPEQWGKATRTWLPFFEKRPFLAGTFAWTGFDYRGEPSPRDRWPCISSNFGILDLCGFPKDNFYYCQAWWTSQPMLHLLPHWNWAGREGQEIDVWCYSNCDEVELFLNSRSLGLKTMERYGYLSWNVPYEAGVLLGKGYKRGKLIAEKRVETTGTPAALRLQADHAVLAADGKDVSVVTVAVLDAQGLLVPVASNEIRFALTGPGRIIGVGNGDPSCHEPDQYLAAPGKQPWKRSVFNGLAQIIVQAGKAAGMLELQAEAKGLRGCATAIELRTLHPES